MRRRRDRRRTLRATRMISQPIADDDREHRDDGRGPASGRVELPLPAADAASRPARSTHRAARALAFGVAVDVVVRRRRRSSASSAVGRRRRRRLADRRRRPGRAASPAGVGSNCVQPRPASHTSGHACASRGAHRELAGARVVRAGREPTATRAGRPTARAIAAYAPANCSQNPRRESRKSVDRVGAAAVDRAVEVVGEASPSRKKSSSRCACSYGVVAPAHDPRGPAPHRRGEVVGQLERRRAAGRAPARRVRVDLGRGSASVGDLASRPGT